MAYCVRADIEDVYGVENVKVWADLDNDGDEAKITARITKALARSYAKMNDYLRGGPYNLPLANAALAIPDTAIDINATLAGIWLYEKRGHEDILDTGRPLHRYSSLKTQAFADLRNIRFGVLNLDAVRSETTTTPQAIADDYDEETTTEDNLS